MTHHLGYEKQAVAGRPLANLDSCSQKAYPTGG